MICAAMTRHGMVMPRSSTPSRGVAQMTMPNQRARMSQPSVATSTPESSSRHSCQNASGAAMPASAATTGSHRGKPPRRDRLLYGGERVHDPGSRRCGGPCSPGETLVGYPCPALMPGIGVGEEISRRPAVAAGLAIRTGTTRLDGDPRPAGPRHRVPHKGPRDRRGIRPPG